MLMLSGALVVQGRDVGILNIYFPSETLYLAS